MSETRAGGSNCLKVYSHGRGYSCRHRLGRKTSLGYCCAGLAYKHRHGRVLSHKDRDRDGALGGLKDYTVEPRYKNPVEKNT